MTHVIRDFEIPDATRLFAREEWSMGPSGELIPFKPTLLEIGSVQGRPVEEIVTCVGTYGMGGPGFFGLRLGSEWLIISVWGASEWILVDDRLVGDLHHKKYGRPLPWIHQGQDALSPHLVGSTITSLLIEKHHLALHFSSDSVLTIDEDAQRRPLLEGTKEPRVFTNEDDLRHAVFLCPTTEIWI